MKKLLVVLLSLGLIVAFGATASAADVKFTGMYYVLGAYENNNTVQADNLGPSAAYFRQQFRMKTEFVVAQGLSLTTQFDALEKNWGNTNWRRGAVVGEDTTSSRPSLGVAGANVEQSLEFEQVYMTFMTGIGQFQIGYQPADTWGTQFLDNGISRPRAMFLSKVGPVTFMAVYEKWYETVNNSVVAATIGKVDADNDTYALAGIYKQGPMEAGLLYKYFVFNAGRVTGGATKATLLSPYMKATFGPVYVESELAYAFGKTFASELPGVSDNDLTNWAGYIRADLSLGPAKIGALFAYTGGDDYEVNKTKVYLGGYSWNPALILLNNDLNNYRGASVTSHGPITASTNRPTNTKKNTVWYGINGSYKATPKLDVTAALTMASVAEKKLAAGVEAVSDKLGTEFDVTATYKLYDNLSYMVGAGYLWTGDYFKLNNAAAKVENDYLLINKLTLNF